MRAPAACAKTGTVSATSAETSICPAFSASMIGRPLVNSCQESPVPRGASAFSSDPSWRSRAMSVEERW